MNLQNPVAFAEHAIRWRERSLKTCKWNALLLGCMIVVIMAFIGYGLFHHHYPAALSLVFPVLMLGFGFGYVLKRYRVLQHEIRHWAGRLKIHHSALSEQEYQDRKRQLREARTQQHEALEAAGLDPQEMESAPSCDCGRTQGMTHLGVVCSSCDTECRMPIPYRPRTLPRY